MQMYYLYCQNVLVVIYCQYYEYMVGYTAKQNPIRLENKMRKEAELQQKCASFSPRVAPYVYGLNEVEEFENNSHFIAMEYMEESLKDCFKNRLFLEPPKTLTFGLFQTETHDTYFTADAILSQLL